MAARHPSAQIRDGLQPPPPQMLRDFRAVVRGDVLCRGLDRRRGVPRRLQVFALRVGGVFQPGPAARVRLAREQCLRESFGAAERIGTFQEFEDGFRKQLESTVDDAVIAGHDDAQVAVFAGQAQAIGQRFDE